MIQDIEPHQYDNVYHPALPQAQDFLLCYKGNRTLVKQNGEKIVFPTFQDAEKGWEKERESLYQGAVYLFSIGVPMSLAGRIRLLKGSDSISTRRWKTAAWRQTDLPGKTTGCSAGEGLKYLNFAGITGWQLYRWYESRSVLRPLRSPNGAR